MLIIWYDIYLRYNNQIMFGFLKKKNKKQAHSSQLKPENIVMMESDTLGMTVIEEAEDMEQNLKELQPEEWVDIISEEKFDGYPYRRIYFSFLKGIPVYLRMKIWLFLVKRAGRQEEKIIFLQQQDKKMFANKIDNRKSLRDLNDISTQLYQELSSKKPEHKQHSQIQKDIHRSFSGKEKYLYTQPLLRKILYAQSNYGVEYTQGMNYILLNIIIYCLQSIGLNQQSFHQLYPDHERDIFIILVGIVLKLQQVFGNNNIFKVIKDLQEKIAQSFPQILFLIYKYGMDCFSCFSPNYFSVMSYGDPPQQLCKLMMDLFFLQGEVAIHAMIIRMLQLAESDICKIQNAQQLQNFLKRDIFHICYKKLKQKQSNASKLEDFGMSFYKNIQKV